jgi:hypothetical protein
MLKITTANFIIVCLATNLYSCRHGEGLDSSAQTFDPRTKLATDGRSDETEPTPTETVIEVVSLVDIFGYGYIMEIQRACDLMVLGVERGPEKSRCERDVKDYLMALSCDREFQKGSTSKQSESNAREAKRACADIESFLNDAQDPLPQRRANQDDEAYLAEKKFTACRGLIATKKFLCFNRFDQLNNAR